MASNPSLDADEILALGLKGADYVTGTGANSGSWFRIVALADTVIASLTAANVGGTLTSIPLSDGNSIQGEFTAFTLTSGKVWAYRL
jgi:hypothetical protein